MAETHHLQFVEILNMYGKDIKQLQFIVGDNCNTNKSLANRLRVPLVGCASHRLNLAIQQYYKDLMNVILKIDILMGKLKKISVERNIRRRQVASTYTTSRDTLVSDSSFSFVDCNFVKRIST